MTTISPDDPRAFLPLSASAFHILLALAEGERHGYSISKEVETATAGSVRLGPGTLYRLVKQMLADGWIAEVTRVDPEDPRRRFYRLQPWGRRIAGAEASRLAELVRIAQLRNLLPGIALP
jgi:DNA-binding PadR family transcriptional regulator